LARSRPELPLPNSFALVSIFLESNMFKDSVPVFLNDIFNMSKPFSKSDLDMITEIYKMMEKNVK
jgi:hypothetical protein